MDNEFPETGWALTTPENPTMATISINALSSIDVLFLKSNDDRSFFGKIIDFLYLLLHLSQKFAPVVFLKPHFGQITVTPLNNPELIKKTFKCSNFRMSYFNISKVLYALFQFFTVFYILNPENKLHNIIICMYAAFRVIKPLLYLDLHFFKNRIQDNPNNLISHINISLYFQKINSINEYFMKKRQKINFSFKLLLSFHNLLLFLIIAL